MVELLIELLFISNTPSKMTRKLKILVAPMFGVGHVNATIGIAQSLKERGHQVVYVLDQSFEGQLVKYGFEEEILREPVKDNGETNGNMKAGEEPARMLKESGILSGLSPLEKLKLMSNQDFMAQMLQKKIDSEPQLQAIVDKVNPDIILVDDFFGLPSLIYSGRPWVSICSGNPLFYIRDSNLPPPGSGMSMQQSIVRIYQSDKQSQT